MKDCKLEETKEVFLHGEGRQASLLLEDIVLAPVLACKKGLGNFVIEASVCGHAHTEQPMMPAAQARRAVTFPSTPF